MFVFGIAMLLTVCSTASAQTIPNYKRPLFVSHLSGRQKIMITRAGAPKHNAITKVICFKTPCRGVVGWTRTQQRNKFKKYKKPGIPRLKYLKYDSLKGIETTPQPGIPAGVPDTVSIAADQPVPIPKDSTMTFVFDDVLFDLNSSHLKDAFTKRLDSLSSFIKRSESYHIRIVGHTDNSGSERSNATLSQDRAEAVASYLASTGIERNAITAEGRGSAEPIAGNERAEGRQKNRRVEIFLSFD
jgi:outer membrane protein OmpA-like peptidoglycan-associated protein